MAVLLVTPEFKRAVKSKRGERWFNSPEEALYARKCVHCGSYAVIGSPIVKLKGVSALHSYIPVIGALCKTCVGYEDEHWEYTGLVTLAKGKVPPKNQGGTGGQYSMSML